MHESTQPDVLLPRRGEYPMPRGGTHDSVLRQNASISCHLLVDPPASGSWNMALDEALLEHVAAGDPSVWLRFYQWHEPTLSLGYFQSHGPWRAHVQRDCAVVRRRTGGGAILHDRELTYSFVLPPQHPLAGQAEYLYRLVHEALIAALGRYGIAARLSGNAATFAPHQEPFLCFERRSASDVVIDAASDASSETETVAHPFAPRLPRSDYKICGSAQRRCRGALLLHGSLLLAASPVTPQLPGMVEITGIKLSQAEIRDAWAHELLSRLGGDALDRAAVPSDVLERARELEQSRFSSDAWTMRR